MATLTGHRFRPLSRFCTALLFAFLAITATAAGRPPGSTDRAAVPAALPGSPPAGSIDLPALLWPGGFTPASGTDTATMDYVARGRRYAATVRGAEFRLLPPAALAADPADAWTFRFIGGSEALAATLEERYTPPVTYLGRGAPPRRADARYRRVRYSALYPGIDIVYYASTAERLQFDLAVAAGANPERIRLLAPAGSTIGLDGERATVRSAARTVTFDVPVAYQVAGNERIGVAVHYRTDGSRLWFELGDYVRSRTLIIDPLIVTNSTFVGSSGNDDAINAMTVDANGDIYLAGVTQFDSGNADFPTTPQSYRSNVPLSPDECYFDCGFVVKLSPTYQLLYGALIYTMTPMAIATDSAGQPVVTGHVVDTSNFPTTPGAFSADDTGQVFLAKLTADGTNLVFSALFRGVEGRGLAIDAQDNIYVGGAADLPGLPTTPGTLMPDYVGNGAIYDVDGFLLKVDPTGSTVLAGTYLGGIGADSVEAVALDPQGRPIVAGSSESSDFAGFPGSGAGFSDAYVMRLAPDFSAVEAGRWFAGNGADVANDVVPDQQGGWIVGGLTTSDDLPATPQAIQQSLHGERNGWLARLDGNFDPDYVTYFGGEAIDGVLAVASDAEANAYFAGITFSKHIPTTSDAFQDISSLGTREAYFGVLDAEGSTLLYGTYLGGFYTVPRSYDALTAAWAIARGPSGAVFVAGSTSAGSFPTTANGLRSGMGGIADAFLVRFEDSPLWITTPSYLPSARTDTPYQATLQATGGSPPYRWSVVGFSLPDGLALSSGGVLSGQADTTQTETNEYQFTVMVRDAANRSAHKSFFVGVLYPGQLDCSSGTCELNLLVGQAIVYPLDGVPSGRPPFAWTTTGQLPPGIELSADGTLQGTPTAAGTYAFSVIAIDADNGSVSIPFRITVATSTPPPGGNGGRGGAGGSGGGSTDPVTCCLFGTLLLLRSLRRRAKERTHNGT